jgi:hypothetical protein
MSRGARRRAAVTLAAATPLLLLAGCASSHSSSPTVLIGPSYRKAGPATAKELQAVLDVQAQSITDADWRRYFDLYVPIERQRCSLDHFADLANLAFSELRGASPVTAKVEAVEVDGYRASVGYRLFRDDTPLAPQRTFHYLRIGDRWYLDEKAC